MGGGAGGAFLALLETRAKKSRKELKDDAFECFHKLEQ